MSTTQPTSEQWWDIQEPVIPKRSSLYSLEPIGVGTPHVESLTGYIQRLAYEHCLSTWMLVTRKIAPELDGKYIAQDIEHKYSPFFEKGNRLNNATDVAFSWVQALEILTGRTDLRFLTMLSYKNILTQVKLFRKKRAWCPCCYSDFSLNGQVLYEPLIWTLDIIKICIYHKALLHVLCPHCNQEIPTLSRQLPSAYCSRCRGWLGSNQAQRTSCQIELLDDALKRQTWIVKNIGELVASAPNLKVLPASERIKQNLSQLVQHLNPGSMNNFARELQISNSVIQRACLGENIPSFSNLVEICYQLNISLLDFLTSDSNITNFVDHTSLFFQRREAKSKIQTIRSSSSRHRGSLNPNEIAEIRGLLQSILEDSAIPSPINAITKEIGCVESTLRRHAPDLCHEIVQRRQSLRNAGVSLNASFPIRSTSSDSSKLLTSSELRNYLLATLEEYPPRSLREIANALGYSINILYRRYPDLRYQISKRWTDYKAEFRKKNQEFMCEQVSQVMLKLHSQGKSITEGEVSKYLTKPGYMRDKKVRSFFRSLKSKLEESAFSSI